MITYVMPTRNRLEALARTLAALGALPRHDAQVIVVDNASDAPPRAPVELDNGIGVEVIFRHTNEGAAARNHGVEAADPASEWIVMLDDDSYPLDAGHLAALREQPDDVLAVAAEIFLPPLPIPGAPQLRREAGGLPEVFTGCGVALRRRAFIEAGGYDPSFHYYVEEYDLAAKLLLAGGRVVLDRRFQVMHEKTSSGRDMNVILRRLVRNNAWIAQRYAPVQARRAELREVMTRYAAIAMKERALAGYTAGVAEAAATLPRQPRSPMPRPIFERFTGLAEARRSLEQAWESAPFHSAAIIDEGKNARLIRQALGEMGVRIVAPEKALVLVIGTLSPGPLLDSWDRHAPSEGHRLISPWASLVGASASLPALAAA